jgi:hypothetical protein
MYQMWISKDNREEIRMIKGEINKGYKEIF